MFDTKLLAFLLLVVPRTLFATPQFQSEPRTYPVRGTVVNSATAEPIGGALVQIYGARQRSVLTGPDGKFQFEGMTNGTFALTVRKPGYFSAQEGRRDGVSPAYVMPEEQRPVTLKLIPEGVVYGRITGDNGEPAGQMPVQILWERVANGRRTRENNLTLRTNERGEFRQAELMPGKYFVFVGPSSWPVAFPARLSQTGARGYPGLFYPGVPELSSATAIEIAPGTQVEVNLSVASQPFYRITGTVSGLSPEQAINFEMASASGQPIGAGIEFDEARGTFRSSWVPAGLCTISAQAQNPKMGQAKYATQQVNVTSDLGGVHLALLPNATIPLNIRVEETRSEPQVNRETYFFPPAARNQRGSQPPSFAHVALTLQEHVSIQRQQQYSESITDEDPTPAIRDVPPGVYVVQINPNGLYYVQSARAGSIDLLEQSLTVAPGGSNQPIEVVLRDDFASLEGSVVFGPESQAATVLILAANSLRNAAPWQSFIVTNTSPSFQLSPLAPGEYKIFALENAEDFEYGNPDVVRKYVSRVRNVLLAPNQKTKVELQLVHIGD